MLSDKKNRAIYDQYGAEGLREGVGLRPCAVFVQPQHAFRQNKFLSKRTVPADRVVLVYAIGECALCCPIQPN